MPVCTPSAGTAIRTNFPAANGKGSVSRWALALRPTLMVAGEPLAALDVSMS